MILEVIFQQQPATHGAWRSAGRHELASRHPRQRASRRRRGHGRKERNLSRLDRRAGLNEAWASPLSPDAARPRSTARCLAW